MNREDMERTIEREGVGGSLGSHRLVHKTTFAVCKLACYIPASCKYPFCTQKTFHTDRAALKSNGWAKMRKRKREEV